MHDMMLEGVTNELHPTTQWMTDRCNDILSDTPVIHQHINLYSDSD